MRRRSLLVTLSAAVTAGCTIGGTPPAEDNLTLSAPAFEDGEIPERFTCDGESLSPPLVVEGIPPETESLAIVGEWLRGYSPGTIWTMWNLPADDTLEIPAGIQTEARPDAVPGAIQGLNDEGFVGYRSPCHETPGQNEYRFAVLALERPLDAEPGVNRDDFDDAIGDKVLSSTSLTAIYDRF
ncbi:MAG: Raf kinase inhibitor-like YbhB/YbcL family protein [Natronomonas sp.]|jgi:Raf kinase inhibitor-like YbhB/YbcL family protein|uniref:YbhB/YbcL family Raf kinase inhibitor-like protein n=1 Tax=Natronomonas sp. TaxID=2184060 RepID=UPI003988E6FD